jgi:hypothetical protein
MIDGPIHDPGGQLARALSPSGDFLLVLPRA